MTDRPKSNNPRLRGSSPKNNPRARQVNHQNGDAVNRSASQASQARQAVRQPSNGHHQASRRPTQTRQNPSIASSQPRRRASNAQRQERAVRNPNRSIPAKILFGIGHGIAAIFKAIGRAFTFIWNKSKIVGMAILIACVVGILVFMDGAFTTSNIYKGVHIGDVDVSNMTIDQAEQAVLDRYNPNIDVTSVYVFADEDTANSPDLDLELLEDEAQAEQLSFEEAQKNKKLWIASGSSLDAKIPARELAEQAMAVGRETDPSDRINAFFSGIEIPVHVNFDDTQFTNLVSDINATLGYEVEDYGVEIKDGEATVTEGNAGFGLDNDEFASVMSDKLLQDQSPIVSYVAEIKSIPLKINEQEATLTSDQINESLPDSITFSYNGTDATFDKKAIGNWVTTDTVEEDGVWHLDPHIDASKATDDILNMYQYIGITSDVNYQFFIEDGKVYVDPEEQITMPETETVLASLDEDLFGKFRETREVQDVTVESNITVQPAQYSGRLTLQEALHYGVVNKFSTYTTKYSNTNSTQNRKFNIHLAADLINNSQVEPGDVWSFNDVAGDSNEEAGFKDAGVISSGEYTTGIGGGICQVATTVFNAVFDAGLPIKERHNHTLHSSSYPAGRDAAVSYGLLDLRWKNSTDEPILLQTYYTDTTITVSLIGRDPGLEVQSKTGDWIDGSKYKTKYEVDPNLAPNASYVKTVGTDGMEISVTRTVLDQNGKIVDTNNFYSVYSPITRVVVYGEGSDMDALREKYKEEE